MNYREILSQATQTGLQNVVGLATASVLLWLTILPLFAAIPFGISAVLGGLWTTSLLFGIGLVSMFRFLTAAVEEEVAVSVLPHFIETVRHPSLGLKLGLLTFGLIICTLVVVEQTPNAYRATIVGIAAFIFLCWYVVTAFASPSFVDNVNLRSALRAGVARAVSAPMAVIVFVLLSVVCTAIAGVTVIIIFLFLPSVLALLGVVIVRDITTVTKYDRSRIE